MGIFDKLMGWLKIGSENNPAGITSEELVEDAEPIPLFVSQNVGRVAAERRLEEIAPLVADLKIADENVGDEEEAAPFPTASDTLEEAPMERPIQTVVIDLSPAEELEIEEEIDHRLEIGDPFADADPLVRSKDLMNRAAQIKDTDLEMAVRLVSEAVRIHPLDSYRVKLAHLKSLEGDHRQALSIHAERLHELPLHNPWKYCKGKRLILDECRKILERQGQSDRALSSYCEVLWLQVCERAINGEDATLLCSNVENLFSKKILAKLAPSEDRAQLFISRLKSEIIAHQADLQELARSVHQGGESAAARKKIMKEESFLKAFHAVREVSFSESRK